MAKKRKGASSEKLSEVIVKGMLEKKAGDIVIMDLRKIKNAVADFFVICSGKKIHGIQRENTIKSGCYSTILMLWHMYSGRTDVNSMRLRGFGATQISPKLMTRRTNKPHQRY